ncbi:MAG: hypothetical protein IVW54_09150 [Candidatus Binataceae bacterium]|nr:hypothetical protein [Candidatus Binataceae bacterium]
MTLRGAFLWLHVAGGAIWIGACLCFVLAAVVLDAESGERSEFAMRAAPAINQIGLVAAITVILTGLGNLWIAGQTRSYRFAPEFVHLLQIKLALYAIMALATWAAFRADSQMRLPPQPDGRSGAITTRISRLTLLYLATAGCGGVALVLGLWLAGA